MADNATRALWCIVQGDPEAFQVTASVNDNFGHVKKRIKEEAFDNYTLARKLVLWKPHDSSSAKSDSDLARLLAAHELSEFATKLNAAAKVSDIFQGSLPENDLHLIVQIPHAGGTCKRYHSSSSSDVNKRLPSGVLTRDAWLPELHSKIWGREDRRSELFCNVKITLAHYLELQKRLKPGRDLPDYESNDVQSIKLDVLRTSTPLSPSVILPGDIDGEQVGLEHIEGAGDSDSLDDELRSLFPATIQYLDLYSLKLENNPHRIPPVSLIRQEYDIISRLLDRQSTSIRSSAFVSGQPGIGKTAYIYLKIIESMIARRPFMYQTLFGDVYEVSEEVRPVKDTWSPVSPIIAFLDADAPFFAPKHFLVHNFVRLIAATSPKGAEQPWMKQPPYNGVIFRFVANLWSPSELFLAGIFLGRLDFTFARLKESSSYFGFNPRRCFGASNSDFAMHQFRQEIADKIHSIPSGVNLGSLLTATHTSSGLSHSIFELSPYDNYQMLAGARVGAVSMWALNLLLEEYESRELSAVAEFYHSITGTSPAASLRGRMMERQVLKYFDSLQAPQIFEIRSLADSSISKWTYPGPVPRNTFQSSSFTPSLRSAVENQKCLHLVPLDPNFPAVDSILYDPDKGLTGIQVTTKDQHSVAVLGLKRIQGWLKYHTPLAGLQPSILHNHWPLIFVIPDTAAASFKQQTFEGDTASGEWAGKVDQYVLGLREETLWGRTAKS